VTPVEDMVRRFFEAGIGVGDRDVQAEVMAPEFEAHGDSPLAAGVLRTVFFPDLRVALVELIQAGDRFVARLGATATRDGNTVRWEAIQIARVENDRIAEVWEVTDALPWLQALGVVADQAELERQLNELAPDDLSGRA
jgi:predicted ester cyclase